MSVKIGRIDEFQIDSRTYLTLTQSTRDEIVQERLELVLFRIDQEQFYCIETVCPHSGGNLAVGDLEDWPEGKVVICPYHEFEFSLKNGNSSHGFNACTYPVIVENGNVFVQSGLDFQKQISVEKNPVLLNPNRRGRKNKVENDEIEIDSSLSKAIESKLAMEEKNEEKIPDSLEEWAVKVLTTSDPLKKVLTSKEAGKLWNEGKIEKICSDFPIQIPEEPPRDARLNVVPIGKEGKRGKGGTLESRIALLHSLANIEQWAIDLAWDIIARFCSARTKGSDLPLPRDFFTDFVKVALDESKHFTILNERLHEMGSHFGALPVHNGLWESATTTAHDLLCRLAIVHMVHEARGLDVNPATIAKFERAKDTASVATLTTIHNDEITHVGAGHKWFAWVCENSEPQVPKVEHFQELVRKYFRGPLKPPFNDEDRKKAGLSEEWYMPLTKKEIPQNKT